MRRTTPLSGSLSPSGAVSCALNLEYGVQGVAGSNPAVPTALTKARPRVRVAGSIVRWPA